ncbi:hypothetical protein BKA62DRAFT_278867 [Auriculariales sp. MPI-PUGE-AT-0066]|nr:hypothetical protein BKA62DRAFT_278867 [Auriculariales sp. MPI-PUGE-AT-0066]
MRTRTAESLAEHDAEFNERWSQDDLFKEDPDEFRQWKEEQDVRKQVMWDQLERRRKRELELAAGATPTPEDGVQPPRVSNVDLPRRGSGSAPSSPSSRDRSPLPETWQENAGPSTGPAASAESRYAMRSPPGATRVVAKRPREPDAPAAATEDSPRKKRAIDDSRPTRLSPRRALVNAKFRGATVLADSTASTPASRMTPPSIPVGAKHKDKAMTVDPQPTDSNGANMDIDAHERTAPIEDQSNVTVNTSRRPAQYSGSKVKSDCALGPVETKGSALASSIAPKRRGTAPGTLSRGNVTLESTPNTSLVKKTAGARREPTAAQLRKAEKAEKEREKKEREALFAREKKMTHPEYITYLADKVYVNPRATVCKGLVFLYVHCEPNRVSDQSRQRYVIMYNKLGAEVVQTYSERVTHIIVERNGLERQLVIACNITSADELPPRVKTFTWDWVVYCLTYKRIPPPEHDANYERFPKRLVLVLNARAKKLAPPPRKRDGDDTTDEEEEEPSLPIVSQDESSLPTPVIPVFAQASSSSAKRSSDVQIAKSRTEVDQQLPKLTSTSSSHPRTSGAHDPLAEFYEEAMFQLEDRMSDDEWDELEEKAARKTKQTVGSMDGQASGSNGKGKQLKVRKTLQTCKDSERFFL